MKLNFCTLFNSSYLSRGLVMYESLLQHCDDFHLYVFAFDDKSHQFLKSQNYKSLTVISLKEFEDEELLKVKGSRTAAEYCWTSTASTILYSIQKFNLSNCTYLDADMQFFSNPRVLIDEMGSDSVLITAHRYTPAYDQSAESGKYCVQFVTFKNDERGMKVLKCWRASCIEWCYARVEDGKFGDQKYLDDFCKFEGVHELQHLGGGLAPWNVQQYSFEQKGGKLVGSEIATGKTFEAVFFHFHGLKFFEDDIVSLTSARYQLNENIKTLFYKPYVRALNKKKEEINAADKTFDPNGSAGKSPQKPANFILVAFFYLYDLRRSIKYIFGQNVKNRLNYHYYYYSRKF